MYARTGRSRWDLGYNGVVGMSAGRRVVDYMRVGAEGSALERRKKGMKGLRHSEYEGGKEEVRKEGEQRGHSEQLKRRSWTHGPAHMNAYVGWVRRIRLVLNPPFCWWDPWRAARRRGALGLCSKRLD
jgi:hypothetical protein